jgi:hypothetical protein
VRAGFITATLTPIAGAASIAPHPWYANCGKGPCCPGHFTRPQHGGNTILAEHDSFNEDNEGRGDNASPATALDGIPTVTPGMENVQQLPGEGTTNVDIELPPANDNDH